MLRTAKPQYIIALACYLAVPAVMIAGVPLSLLELPNKLGMSRDDYVIV
jgi:hypothetical protein